MQSHTDALYSCEMNSVCDTRKENKTIPNIERTLSKILRTLLSSKEDYEK